MKIHIIIKTCERYSGTRLKLIRETWLPTVPEGMEYTIAFGWEAPEGGNPDPHVYYTGTPDDYRYLPGKNLAAMRHALETDWDWLFTCDDDSYLIPARLQVYLSSVGEDVCAIGCRHAYKVAEIVNRVNGGSGYAIRRKAVEHILARNDSGEYRIPPTGGDDCEISRAVYKAGYPWLAHPYFRLLGNPADYYVAQHCFPYTKMQDLHEYYITHPDVP